MVKYYDPKYSGNQWYLPTKSSQLYNPRSKDDVDSRNIWYNTVIKTDLINDMKFRRKVAMKKYPHLSLRDIELFLKLRPPEYS
jgi:hypothetical protein